MTIEERQHLIVITEDNQVLPGDPALLDGWLVTLHTVIHESGPIELSDEADSSAPPIEVATGELEGEVLVDGVFDSTPWTTGGLTGGTTGSTSTGSTNGGTTGDASTGGSTTGSTTGSTSGTTTGGTTGGTTTGGSTGGTTGGTSTGGSTGTTSGGTSTGGSTGGTAGGGTGGTGGTSGGSAGPFATYTNMFFNWESQASNFPGVIDPQTPLVYNSPPPHNSGLYTRIMSKKGFGYISADLYMPEMTAFHCAPRVEDGLGNPIPIQTRDVPYNYVKMDALTPGKHVYAEAGLKYERWILDGQLQPKFWKTFFAFKALGMETTEYQAFVKNTPVGENRDFETKLYVTVEGGKLYQCASMQISPLGPPVVLKKSHGAIQILGTNKQAGFVTSIAQSTAEFYRLNEKWHQRSIGGPITKLGTGSWIERFGISNVRISPEKPESGSGQVFNFAAHVQDSNPSVAGHATYHPIQPLNPRNRHIGGGSGLTGWLTTIDNSTP